MAIAKSLAQSGTRKAVQKKTELVLDMLASNMRESAIAKEVGVCTRTIRKYKKLIREEAANAGLDVKARIAELEGRFEARRRRLWRAGRFAEESGDLKLVLETTKIETAIDKEHINLLVAVGYLTQIASGPINETTLARARQLSDEDLHMEIAHRTRMIAERAGATILIEAPKKAEVANGSGKESRS